MILIKLIRVVGDGENPEMETCLIQYWLNRNIELCSKLFKCQVKFQKIDGYSMS